MLDATCCLGHSPGPDIGVLHELVQPGRELSRLGLDCVIWGPGSIEVAHKPNEWLSVAEFVRAGDGLTRVVHRACVEGLA